MNDLVELINDLNEIIAIQGKMITKLTDVLMQHIEIDEIESLMDGRDEVERLCNKWKD